MAEGGGIPSGKRGSTVGPKIPVATPNIGGLVNNTVPLETALAGCIGARIRITTTSNATFDGTLFTADPISNLIAINTAPPPPTPATANTAPQPGDYRIIPISRLQSFALLALAPEMAVSTTTMTTTPATAAAAAADAGGAAPAAVLGGGGGGGGGPQQVSFGNAVPAIRKVDRGAVLAREKMAVERDLKKDRARGRGVGKEAQEIYDALNRTLPVRWHDQAIIVLDVVLIDPPYGPEDCRSPSADNTALQRVKKVLEMEKRKVVHRNTSTNNSRSNSTNTNANVNVNANAKLPPNVHPSTAAPPIAIPSPIPAGGPRKGG
ncbi:MAG: hypothetical protein M1816_006389 [Peltula sp. TS41687]|nr:MAG: hypothetical protein M1816_006389 [Peltula sp. TS41687]